MMPHNSASTRSMTSNLSTNSMNTLNNSFGSDIQCLRSNSNLTATASANSSSSTCFRPTRILLAAFVGLALFSVNMSRGVVQNYAPDARDLHQQISSADNNVNDGNNNKQEIENLRQALEQAELGRIQAKEEANAATQKANSLLEKLQDAQASLPPTKQEEKEKDENNNEKEQDKEALLAKAQQERDEAKREATAAAKKAKELETKLQEANQLQPMENDNDNDSNQETEALAKTQLEKEQAQREANEAKQQAAALKAKLTEALNNNKANANDQQDNKVKVRIETPKDDKDAVVATIETDESENILDQVIRLLIPSKKDADAYIQKLPGDKFRFYLYELPDPYNYQYVSQCLEKKYVNASNCDWGQSVCTEVYTNDIKYSKRRFNRNGDVVVAKVLSDYNGPLRTKDPQKADLFIVPYPAAGNCECRKYYKRCYKDIKDSELDEMVQNSVKYFNNETRHKHLFLVSNIYDDMHYYFRDQGKTPLVTTVGPALGCANEKKKRKKLHKHYKYEDELAISFCGQIVMPYANLNPQSQPPELRKALAVAMTRTNSKEAIMEERPNAMAAFISSKIDGNPWARIAFLEQVEKMNYTLAGMPILTGKIKKGRTMGNEGDIAEAYRQSIFCPILRGDYPPQKRFFDVMLNGCIPVVLESPSSEYGFVSHFSEKGIPARLSYPFGKGVFPNDPNERKVHIRKYSNSSHNENLGIDFSKLVVAVDESCHIDGCMMPALEHLILHHPGRIRQKQKDIARYVSLFSYGMEDNGMKYPDAIAAMLVQARHYVHSIYGIDKSERLHEVEVAKKET